MEILASSLSTAGEVFLHAGYVSAQATAPYALFAGPVVIAAAMALEHYKNRNVISKKKASQLSLALMVIFLLGMIVTAMLRSGP